MFQAPFPPFPFKVLACHKAPKLRANVVPIQIVEKLRQGEKRGGDVRGRGVGLAANHCAPCFAPNAPGKTAIRISLKKKRQALEFEAI